MADKYDRQLRLWGAAGQRALMEARICVIGAGPTATETLKNLVLPGCGYVCIIDPDCCTARDMANNFFVAPEDIGEPRAKVALGHLLEMNEDVKGSFRVDSFDRVLREDPAFFRGFSLVIATQLHEQALTPLADFLFEHGIPLLTARSFGLVGTSTAAVPELRILHAKGDDAREDLRIGSPFPALRAFADAVDLRALDALEFGHVPFLVLLIKAMDAWRAAGDAAAAAAGLPPPPPGRVPASRAEKDTFKAALRFLGEAAKGTAEALPANFAEALEAAQLAWVMEVPGPETLELLGDARAEALSPTTPEFWLVVRALRDLAAQTGALPVSGRLPDMTATTDMYVSLQRIFHRKAADDVAVVTELVESLAASCGATLSPSYRALVEHACKNVRSLRCVRYKSLTARLAVNAQATETLTTEFSAAPSTYPLPEQAPVAWFVMQRAVDAFRELHGRFPCSSDSNMSQETDAHVLMREVHALLAAQGVAHATWSPVLSVKHAEEMCRYNASELHAVAAVMGGIAAQEAVKIITQQYVPINGTLVFNGIACISAVLEL